MFGLIPSPVRQVLATWLAATPPTLLLTGPPAVYRLSLRCAAYLARRQLVLYLDGANRFDPYELARYAEARNLSVEALLRSVFVRRAFTCYQMYEMVARLPVERLRARHAVLIVAGPCVSFSDDSVTEYRARRLFRRMMARLEAVAQTPLPILIVQPGDPPDSARRSVFTEFHRWRTLSAHWMYLAG